MRPSDADIARARFVRTVLTYHGHTQTDLGRLLGVTQVSASHKLRGTRAFKTDELLKLADAYGIDPGALLRPPALEPVLGSVTEAARDLLTCTFYSLPQVRAYGPVAPPIVDLPRGISNRVVYERRAA